MTKRAILLISVLIQIYTGNGIGQVTWIKSSASRLWEEHSVVLENNIGGNAETRINLNEPKQMVDGFGICFNELGWTALSILEETERQALLKNLFDTEKGLKLSNCRMPIGANDYARNYYSLNDSVNDFDMKYFSISRDENMLIPYIKAAMKYNPHLKIWGSPWTPPYWMKKNNHYACRPDIVNDMTADQAGREGVTQFRMQPEYLNAYALYFLKYIQAYQDAGINITGIHVQNEMNSCQNFPSCIWNAGDLGTFIGNYLGPLLKKAGSGVEIWYGTVERPSIEKIDTIMQNPAISQYITGVSFQWAGKSAIPGVHSKYPSLKLIQSETECGNGSNDWKAAEYTFSLMKHYFIHGISAYTFWNSVLDESGKSMWGWQQNSLITIDSKTRKVAYNPEYYLLKHFSYFIRPGSHMLTTSGKNDDLLAFRNADGSIVVIAGNTGDLSNSLTLEVGGKILKTVIEPHSFNTFVIGKKSLPGPNTK